MYGKSILIEEINELLSKSVVGYIKDNNIRIIGDPLPVMEKTKQIDWDNQKEFDFEYLVGLVDSFTVDYQVRIESYEVEVDDKTIGESLERLKRDYGNYSEPEEYMDGDDIMGALNQPGSEEKKDIWLLHDQLGDSVKNKLAGRRKDDKITVIIEELFTSVESLATALKISPEEAKAMSGEYELTLAKIHRLITAELNQDLFDKVFGKDIVKTEEEFRSRVAETIRKNYDHEAGHYTEHRIQEKLLESTPIGISDHFYKKWIMAVNKGELSEKDIEENYDKYLKDLKWSLIFNRVSEDNQIKVEHEDVLNNARNLIRSQFAAYGIVQGADENIDTFANNYLKGKDGENYINTYNRVKSGKVMEILKEKLGIIYKKVSPDEFLAAVKGN
jgi:trigger factor